MSWSEALDDLDEACQGAFGESAVFTPKGGVEQVAAVSVILEKQPAHLSLPGGLQSLAPGGSSEWTLEVNASEIDGGIVGKDDKFDIEGGASFYVNKQPTVDARGKVWTCELRLAT